MCKHHRYRRKSKQKLNRNAENSGGKDGESGEEDYDCIDRVRIENDPTMLNIWIVQMIPILHTVIPMYSTQISPS